ncbi:uncharacterized protein LOC111278700 [Durio zibethinus]|uniref:Uncharacterized protein LOC111278700 n=1 Tax=Durio zibethinus TaxID=66656 RepID=A0A6P5WZV7_DURZI|nr:uncharacterized protein LOC111278700 [Durio zibethinus]
MMSRIPGRLNRIAVAFNEAAKAPMRLCQSSGSEHSPEDSTDLSDLVNSFLERDCEIQTDEGKIHQEEEEEKQDDSDGFWSEYDTKQMLKNLLSNAHDGNQEEDVKQKIRKETELACQLIIGDRLSEGFKRQLVSHLRDKGFDAGLCKSRWEKVGQHIAGNYEYVDVNINGIRYIVEVNLRGEFEIARPTTCYASLLEDIPPIFVGKTKELKRIVKLMCKAMRESMESRDMHVPPWRRSGYMQLKWFARYGRTVNEFPVPNASQSNNSVPAPARRPVGFEAIPTISFHCRDNYASKAGLKVGYLAAAFNSTS